MRRAILAAVPVLATGAAAAVIVVGGDGDSGDAQAQRGATGVATVERRTLVDSAIVAGTLGYADARSVVNRLSGTVTWLPSVGAVVRPGETLLRVDGEPVVLMDGRIPAYRALRSGVADGADVLQLERGLRALGHTTAAMDVDRHWDAATTAAVKRWQDVRGIDESGEVELGRIAFLPGARRVTEQKVDVGSAGAGGIADVGTRDTPTALAAIGGVASAIFDATVGGAPAQAQTGTPTSTATTPDRTTTTDPTAPTTTTPTTTTPATTAPARTTTTPAATTPAATTPAATPGSGTTSPETRGSGDGALPGASAAAAGERTGSADGDASDSGSGGTATTVLQTTSTRRVVTVALDVADQQLAAVGRRVEIELPDGATIPGRIGRVGTVATTDTSEQADPGSEQTTTIDVTIRLTGKNNGGRLDKAPVSVSLARESRRGALTVPVTALVARRGGGYAVERIASGGTRSLVPVEPGLYADGDVEIVRGLREGDRVAVPR